MTEEFEDRDLSGAVFWGVNLQQSMFRDVDLTSSTFFHVLAKDVSIDGEIDRLVVNGVDITDYVNSHDRWWPLRNNLSPETLDGVLESWTIIQDEWTNLLEHVADGDPSMVDGSVSGEWTLTETLRHLIFAMDKWFSMPILGKTSFTSIGLPNTSSQGKDWSGLDMSATVDFESVLAERTRQHERFRAFISSTHPEDLPETVTVPENGTVPAFMCLHAVLEEEFEHLRYVIRDLSVLGVC